MIIIIIVVVINDFRHIVNLAPIRPETQQKRKEFLATTFYRNTSSKINMLALKSIGQYLLLVNAYIT